MVCSCTVLTYLTYVLFGLVLILFGSRFFIKWLSRWNGSYKCLVGKTCIVTGANSGIGLYTYLDFAKRGAHVILACRNADRAEEARRKIVKETGNENITIKLVDLKSLQSVKNFCKDINETVVKIDILVNNAGAGGVRHRMTEDGLEINWQNNYFGPVLLTCLLLPKLKASGHSRIVNVASVAAKYSNLRPQDVNMFPDRKFTSLPRKYAVLYGWTKLANILFSSKLAQILADSNVNVYAVHPGVVATNIFSRVPFKTLFNMVIKFISKSSEEGAQTTIYCAVSDECAEDTGKLYAECTEIKMYDSCADKELMEKVWNVTENLLREHLM